MFYRTVVALAITLILLSPAYAHKISTFGYQEGDMVYTESYFASGDRCKNCTVNVIALDSGKTVANGRTDNEGVFDFKYTGKESLRITVDAGSGHMGSYTIKPEEAVSVINVPTVPSSGAGDMGTEALLDIKLRPIRRELVALRAAVSRPGITEILGGIGYIIGIAGIWAYMKSREKK